MAHRILRPRVVVSLAALVVFAFAVVALEGGMQWAVAAATVFVLLVVAFSLDADDGRPVGHRAASTRRWGGDGGGGGGYGGGGGDAGGGGGHGGWGGDAGGGGGWGGDAGGAATAAAADSATWITRPARPPVIRDKRLSLAGERSTLTVPRVRRGVHLPARHG